MWRHNVVSLQCDAAHLPVADESVDLIVTSPPYFSLRDYGVDGQIGDEPTPQEYLKVLLDCTREWVRVLKPRGSIFVNLGDKYAGGGGGPPGKNKAGGADFPTGRGVINTHGNAWGYRPKSLIGIPERYMLGCIDDLGLIFRQKVIWSKPNGLPEAVKDRCRVSHEQVFHFTRQGDYYSAIDRLREDQQTKGTRHEGKSGWQDATDDIARGFDRRALNPDGKLPSNVWEIPLQPLCVPKHTAEETLDGSSFDFDHFAAFPPALPRKIILGWSPKDVCTACGQGRFPVSDGSACACTPFIDHRPGKDSHWCGSGSVGQEGCDVKGKVRREDSNYAGGAWGSYRDFEKNEYGRGPVREYLLDQWEPPPVVPGVVLDPFGGTGTTAIAAAKMSRRGITCDLSYGCAKHLVEWRMYDLSQNRRK